METKQGISKQVSGTGGGSGSSVPSIADYVSHVAVNKIGGPNTAITTPISISVKFPVPASPGVVDGGLSTTATGVVFTDGTNTAALTATLPAAGTDVIIGVDITLDGMRIGRVL